MKQLLLIVFIVLIGLGASAQYSYSISNQEKQKAESELKIYPNPCKNSQVTIELPTEQITEVRFVNITGKEVLKENYFYPLQKATIRVDDLPDGIYILRITTSENRNMTKKLMVSKS